MDSLTGHISAVVLPPHACGVFVSHSFFACQAHISELYGSQPFTERRLRAIATTLFTQISRNFATPEQAFLRYARPENRCHVVVHITVKGLHSEQCHEPWQQGFSCFLERLLQVGVVSYQRRRVDADELEREYCLFRQSKPHMLFLFDDNDVDKKRGLSVPRIRSLIKGSRYTQTKPLLYGWHGKTVEAVKDRDTGLTAYQDVAHPLSVPPQTFASNVTSLPVHVGEGDLPELWASRLGEFNHELLDRSVACGLVTEFVHETPGQGLPSVEEFSEKVYLVKFIVVICCLSKSAGESRLSQKRILSGSG